MYHNPNATHPVNADAFPDIAHGFLNQDDGHCYEVAPEGHVATSAIFVLRPTGEELLEDEVS